MIWDNSYSYFWSNFLLNYPNALDKSKFLKSLFQVISCSFGQFITSINNCSRIRFDEISLLVKGNIGMLQITEGQEARFQIIEPRIREFITSIQ